jgi:hypothetical protein
MLPNYDDFLIKCFEQPDDVRTFEKGKFEIVKVGSMTIGRASYEPGWKWSAHVGAATGAALCDVEHVGMVVSGCAACQMKDGRYYECGREIYSTSDRATTAGWSAMSHMCRCIFLARNITRNAAAKIDNGCQCNSKITRAELAIDLACPRRSPCA